MSLVVENDFNTHTYPEIRSKIDRDNEGLLQKAINTAEGKVKGYLSRFDIAALFAATGDNRDDLLMNHIKDIAMWHFAKLAQVNMDLDLIRQGYEDAELDLEKIQKGTITPFGWPAASAEQTNPEEWTVVSNPRRETKY